MKMIRNFFYLIFAIIVGFLGIKFSLYGLMVNVTGNSLEQISLIDATPEVLKTKRYIKIMDGISLDSPIKYVDENGKVKYMVYALLKRGVNDSISDFKSNLIVESKGEINDWSEADIKGLLKPYWYRIDDEIIQEFAYRGIEVDKSGYCLELNTKPWKWYWYLLILLVAILFFID